MQTAIRRSIPLLALLIPLVCGSGLAYAQSGSAGGSIGNDEKSLSGSRSGGFFQNRRGATRASRTNRAAPAQKAEVAATISMAPGSSAASA